GDVGGGGRTAIGRSKANAARRHTTRTCTAQPKYGARLLDRHDAEAADRRAADVSDKHAIVESIVAVCVRYRRGEGIDVGNDEAVLATQPRKVGTKNAVLVGIFGLDRDIAAAVIEILAGHDRAEIGRSGAR